MLLGRQSIDEHHLGCDGITALDVTDVVALDSSRWCRQLQQLRQILGGQSLLFLTLLRPQQFEFSVALHQFDQVRLLSLLGTVNLHFPFPLLRQPVLQKLLLREGVLHEQLGRHLDRIHLGIVLFNHPLQDQPRLQGGCIGGVTQAPHQFSGPHLEQLDRGQAFVTGEGQHIPADAGVGKTHLLVSGQLIQPLQLIPNPGGRFEVQALGVAVHLLIQQTLQFIAAPLKHHGHLAQGAVVVL